MPPKLTAIAVEPGLATVTVGAPLTFTATARYVNGKDAPLTTCRWSIDSGASATMGGAIGVTTGKLIARKTPGLMVIRATHPTSGMYALASITVVAVAPPPLPPAPEPDPAPDPVPEPTPTTPPPVILPASIGLFAYGASTSEVGRGKLFTTTIRSLGPWTPAELDAVQASGGQLLVTQGGYDKFQTNGEYDPDKMDAWILSHRPYAARLQAAVEAQTAAGRLVGAQVCDDFASTERWPLRGVSPAELQRILNFWKATYPWMPLALRGRPRQLTVKLNHLAFFICQFRYWGGLGTPTQFRDAELALAASWNQDILWSVNFLDGGSNVGGIKTPMTAAQLRGAMLVFAGTTSRNRGVGGWKHDPGYLAGQGILAALTDAKTALP